jgi:hypothetical protein
VSTSWLPDIYEEEDTCVSTSWLPDIYEEEDTCVSTSWPSGSHDASSVAHTRFCILCPPLIPRVLRCVCVRACV